MKTIKNKEKERGLTLVELLVALAISVIIISSIVFLLRYSQDAFYGTETQSDIQQNARVGLDLMVRELRMAKGFVNILNSMVTFRADIQGTNDTVEYIYDPANKRLTRNLNGVGAFPLAENVKVAGLYFRYYTYDTNGSSVLTSNPANVNRILVNLSVESQNRVYTLSADVSPRNMDPSGTSSSGGTTPPTPPPGNPFLIVSASPAAPASVRADGIATATVIATLWDANGNPWPNTSVTITATPAVAGADATFENGLSSITGITDGGGQLTAFLKSLRCDGVNFSITGTGGGVSSQPVFVRFFQGPPSIINLATNPSKTLACNNGGPSQPITVTATVLDQCSQIVADGTQVNFSTTPASGVTFSPSPVTTLNGVASVSMSRSDTTSAPNLLLTASAGSANGSVTVPFLAGPPYGQIVLSINPSLVKADGMDQATISAVVKDQCGNLVADGTKVTLTTSLGFFVGALTPTQIELNTASGVVTAYLKSGNAGNATITATSTATVLGVTGIASGSGTVVFTTTGASILVTSSNVSHGDSFQVYIFDPIRRNGVFQEGLNSPFWWAHDCTQSGADDDPFVVLERQDSGVFMISENRYGSQNYINTLASGGSGNLWEVNLATQVSDLITIGYNTSGTTAANGDNTWCTSIQAEAQATVTVDPVALLYVVNSKAVSGSSGNQVLFKVKAGSASPLNIIGMTVEWTDISGLDFSVTNDWSDGPLKPLLQEIRYIEGDVSDPSLVTKELWKAADPGQCGSPAGLQSSPVTLGALCQNPVLNNANDMMTLLLNFAANGSGSNMNAAIFKLNITYQNGGNTYTNTITFLTI